MARESHNYCPLFARLWDNRLAAVKAPRGYGLETYRTMLAVGLRLLLIDDLHDIRGSGVTSMLVELREIGSVVGVSLGCFATREIAYVLLFCGRTSNSRTASN